MFWNARLKFECGGKNFECVNGGRLYTDTHCSKVYNLILILILILIPIAPKGIEEEKNKIMEIDD
jgi:hypothetical protein